MSLVKISKILKYFHEFFKVKKKKFWKFQNFNSKMAKNEKIMEVETAGIKKIILLKIAQIHQY